MQGWNSQMARRRIDRRENVLTELMHVVAYLAASETRLNFFHDNSLCKK